MELSFPRKMYCINDANTGCMRDIDWERGNPYIWQNSDYKRLVDSNKIFARKFHSKQMQVVREIQKSYSKQHT